MVGRIFTILVFTIVGSVALGQTVRGALGGVGPGIVDPRAPFLGPDGVAAAREWSASPASVDLRDRWLRTFHTSLVAASPDVARYDADDLCGFTGGSGGTSKLDGGGWLAALNPNEFDPKRDRVSVDTAAMLLGSLPTRLVVIDEFALGAIASAVTEHAEGDLDHLFLTSGIMTQTANAYEVEHGHLVAHHVAALLRAKGLRLSNTVEHTQDPDAPFVRLALERRLGGGVVVDLYDVDFDEFGSLQRALASVAESSMTDGAAAVVLSWGLTGCALRDAFADLSVRTEGVTQVTVFASLTDFVVAVATEYDAAMAESGSTSMTRSICEAVDASYGFAVSGSSAIGCASPGVRAVVATTVLFASYEELAESALGAADDEGQTGISRDHAYFASAGNEGLPYPMPPGSFDWVTAVAACKPTGPDRAWFSNAGDRSGVGNDAREAIAVGAWFPARMPDADRMDLGYWGTTFAAPLAALASSVGREGALETAPTFDTLCAPARWSEPGM